MALHAHSIGSETGLIRSGSTAPAAVDQELDQSPLAAPLLLPTAVDQELNTSGTTATLTGSSGSRTSVTGVTVTTVSSSESTSISGI